MQTLESSTRSMTLPNYARDGFQQLRDPNYVKNITLGGNMFVQFFNERGGYRIKFPALTMGEYEQLKALYQDQFDNEEFLLFSDDDLGILDEEVFLNLPAEDQIKWDKTTVVDFVIVLEPRFAREFGGS